MKPIICIAPAPAVEPMFFNDGWMVNKKYFLGVSAGGGVPVMATDIELAEEYARLCDGLVLTGSAMYMPSPEYAAQAKVIEKQKRDPQDAQLFYAFQKAGKPVLGICRGQQNINVFLGGTLAKKFKLTNGVEHLMRKHEIVAQPGSLICELFGETFITNSRHNNRIDQLADGLKVTARSHDGVIEAIEHESEPIYAVQWHPERMRGDLPDPFDGPDTTILFQKFSEICLAHKK
ncbi:MAG: gamma-glutamyl-gamma-aminobutyrate hydrolase family protein [Oscillospiraceae bacterium]|jgi:putative glutamine amidotransferase|nr:gamma-glutamyl-gamma-aminobutyrate hydrolase family protein [Oscillospiraceae bacterium]MDD7041544.1 gamma-glutamyl-gamma-aminobutyrate hydrolase family protein [Oscillospiraceae bacterium]MDY2610387.1 gamma-glutamyl-gamma-aminobutyrate hydrolase family protein [Oscillospiraceae bacterium]